MTTVSELPAISFKISISHISSSQNNYSAFLRASLSVPLRFKKNYSDTGLVRDTINHYVTFKIARSVTHPTNSLQQPGAKLHNPIHLTPTNLMKQ